MSPVDRQDFIDFDLEGKSFGFVNPLAMKPRFCTGVGLDGAATDSGFRSSSFSLAA